MSLMRDFVSLDGLWDFVFLGEMDPAKFNPGARATTEKIVVPSAFDALPAYAGRRGGGGLPHPIQAARGKKGDFGVWRGIHVDANLRGQPVPF